MFTIRGEAERRRSGSIALVVRMTPKTFVSRTVRIVSRSIVVGSCGMPPGIPALLPSPARRSSCAGAGAAPPPPPPTPPAESTQPRRDLVADPLVRPGDQGDRRFAHDDDGRRHA